MSKDFSILIGGAAGKGSRKAGLVIAKLFSELGYRIFIYDDYQSLIRGGHNFSQIRASKEKVLSHRRKIDFLLALDEITIEKHQSDLDKEGIIIYNSDKASVKNISNKNKKAVGIAVETIVKEIGGVSIMGNTAFVAGFAKIVGVEWEILEEVLKKEFKKSQELNLKIAKKAFDETKSLIKIDKINQEPLSLLTGNEALCLGAVKAGLDFILPIQ